MREATSASRTPLSSPDASGAKDAGTLQVGAGSLGTGNVTNNAALICSFAEVRSSQV